MKIKKNDTVKVISGKDKGKTGKVLKSLPKENKIVIEGVNLVKKHQKPRRAKEKGQKIEIVKPIDASNVLLVCPRCGRTARVGYKIAGGKKQRVCKKCWQEFN